MASVGNFQEEPDLWIWGLDDSSDFGLVSVDLAEWSTAYPDPVTVPFVGYRRDGSTVTASLTTDGIMDGTGPLADFQTLYFPPEFAGVYQVRIPVYGWSLDNLRIFVPEPGTGTLLGVGAAILAVRFLKSKRRSQRNGVSKAISNSMSSARSLWLQLVGVASVGFALSCVLPPCYAQGTLSWITFDGPPLQPPGAIWPEWCPGFSPSPSAPSPGAGRILFLGKAGA